MLRFILGVKGKKISNFMKKILEAFHLKLFVYKLIILPSQIIALKRLKKIVENSNIEEKKKEDGKKIVFNSMDARYTTHTYLEGGIAKALQIRGHEVKMLICGGLLTICPGHFTVRKPPNKWRCKNCINFSKKFYKISNLPYANYSDYIDKDKVKFIIKKVNSLKTVECENFVYKDVKVGLHSITSTERYFMGGKPERKSYDKILRTQLINAMISTDMAENFIKKENPDILVTSHGCYSTWGSFTEYFINHGIPSRVWATGEGNTTVFDQQNSDKYYDEYYKTIRQQKPLNKEEGKELDEFFSKRMRGEAGQVTIYNFSEVKKGELENQFNFNKFKKTYVLFPNVPWDAALLSSDIVFQSVYEWINHTIKIFLNKSDLLLIIKIHPSEIRVMQSKYTVLDYIKENFDSLPENIKIIPPDTKISPYALFPYIDIGLVYNGTVGLEMATKGIPVVTAGDAHYGKKGFTYNVKSIDEYSKILFENISKLPNQENKARIYSYFHFIKKFQPRPFIYVRNFIDLGWKVKSLDDFKPGKNKIIDHLCNYIVKGGVFQDW